MPPFIPSTPHREERLPCEYRRAAYLPFVWLAIWVIRFARRTGAASPEVFRPARPKPLPICYYTNRQARRGRAICDRRANRFIIKHGRLLNPAKNLPWVDRYWYFYFCINYHVTPAQFREHYLRANDISRVEIYGMDGAHNITATLPSAVMGRAAQIMTRLCALLGASPLSTAAPADPAPP